MAAHAGYQESDGAEVLAFLAHAPADVVVMTYR